MIEIKEAHANLRRAQAAYEEAEKCFVERQQRKEDPEAREKRIIDEHRKSMKSPTKVKKVSEKVLFEGPQTQDLEEPLKEQFHICRMCGMHISKEEGELPLINENERAIVECLSEYIIKEFAIAFGENKVENLKEGTPLYRLIEVMEKDKTFKRYEDYAREYLEKRFDPLHKAMDNFRALFY